MDVYEATATIVKAALDNNLLTLLGPEDTIAVAVNESNSFNISQLCLLINSVKAELKNINNNPAFSFK